MKHRIKEYLDTVFADAERRAPDSVRLRDLKEELLGDLYDKYDHMIEGGRSPSAAYNAVIAGMGDISPLLEGVSGEAEPLGDTAKPAAPPRLSPEERRDQLKRRERAALLTSIAVAMYILCWVPMVILEALVGNLGGVIGLPVMFLMIAAATAMIIYGSMTKSRTRRASELAGDADASNEDDDEDNDEDDDEKDEGRSARSPVYKAISSALWLLTVVAYFVISKQTGAWNITWVLLLMASALDNIIKAAFDLRR